MNGRKILGKVGNLTSPTSQTHWVSPSTETFWCLDVFLGPAWGHHDKLSNRLFWTLVFQEVKVNWASTPSSQKKDTSSKCRPRISFSFLVICYSNPVSHKRRVAPLSLQITSMCLSEIWALISRLRMSRLRLHPLEKSRKFSFPGISAYSAAQRCGLVCLFFKLLYSWAGLQWIRRRNNVRQCLNAYRGYWPI